MELTEQLSDLLGWPVADLDRMLGGASRETWSFTARGRELVARRDPPGAPRGGTMALEAALLQAARQAGVPVPEVLARTGDMLVMERLHGETIARRILRDGEYASARAALTGQCATALARLHTGVHGVPGLPAEPDPLATLRDLLDVAGGPHPALELGLLRLARDRPPPTGTAVVHGDFRLGNLMVGAAGLVGVLDWELAHLGDPAEDLGWLCVRSWRFGGPLPVAGVGTYTDLLDAYAAAGGTPVSAATLRWWEAYGTLRWALLCTRQAAAHLSGAVRSVELAAIGRRTCEVELDLLDLIAPAPITAPRLDPAPPAGPHDRPTAAELAAAVGEWIAGLPLTGRDAFLARVAGNVLGTVQRELALGPELARRHQARLAGLGVTGDVDLAAQVRAGRDDEATVAAIRDSVVDKLVVADPKQLSR